MKKFALLIVAAAFAVAGCAGPAVSTQARTLELRAFLQGLESAR